MKPSLVSAYMTSKTLSLGVADRRQYQRDLTIVILNMMITRVSTVGL